MLEGPVIGNPVAGTPLDVDRIQRECAAGDVIARVLYCSEVSSTNDTIRTLFPPASSDMTALFSDYQRSGRGRQGRYWSAPAYSSILLSVAMPWPEERPLTHSTMLAALGVADAISLVTGLKPALKWPNDVLLSDRKVAGILAESDLRDTGPAVILGMGINCNFEFEELPAWAANATTLQDELGSSVDRAALAVAVLERLQAWRRVVANRPEVLFEAWKARLDTLGSAIVVHEGEEVWEGTAVGVDPQGGLIVETRHGYRRTVYAANISVRSPTASHRT